MRYKALLILIQRLERELKALAKNKPERLYIPISPFDKKQPEITPYTIKYPFGQK